MTEGGFSRKGLDRLHESMARNVSEGQAPGVVTLVSRRGETHVDVVGSKTFGASEPIQRDTIFRISSLSKPLTAAATMVLVDDGKIRLDEPVDRLLPELANRRVLNTLESPLDDTVPAVRPITVEDLLTFRMGFGLVFGPPGMYPIQAAVEEQELAQGIPSPSVAPKPGEWIRRLGELPLMHQPGEKWMYNTGADVLSVLIARASGQVLEEFMSERLFEPLGMKDTGFSVPASKRDRFITSYWTNFASGQIEVYDEVNGQWSKPPAFPSGAGGLVSTVDDYFAFAQMMLGKGELSGRRVLSASSVDLMTRDHLTAEQKAISGLGDNFFESTGWGYGMSVVTKQTGHSGSVGTYGWDGGMGTIWRNDPAEGLIAILMAQNAWTSPIPPPICVDFMTLAHQAITG